MAELQTRNFRKGAEPHPPVLTPENRPVVPNGKGTPREKTLGEKEVELIRAKLRHYTADRPPELWLNTGNEHLHEVLGAPGKGIPYGAMLSISGWESEGKSCLGMDLLSLAQKIDNAAVALVDVEHAYRREWAALRGIDTDRLAVFKTELVYVPKKDKDDEEGEPASAKKKKLKVEDIPKEKMSILSAEQLLSEAEAWVEMKSKNFERIAVLIDSTTALLPREAVEKGLEGSARRALVAAFLSQALPYWMGICSTRNVMLILINQIRESPTVSFGNPEYEPGGNALRFYPSIQTRVKRAAKGGAIVQGGQRIGVRGIITNVKNKVGGVEYSQAGYKIYFRKNSVFLSAEEVKE